MAYIYLLNLYDEIEKRLKSIDTRETAGSSPESERFARGRQDLLNEFKQYLADNMNDKLPRRIRKQLSAKERRQP